MGVNRRADQEIVDLQIGIRARILANQSTGSEMLTITEVSMELGTTIAYHQHSNSDETFFVVEGNAEMLVNGHRFTLGADDALLAQRGIGHSVRNVGTGPLKFISIFPVPDPRIELLNNPISVVNERISSAIFRSESAPVEFRAGVLRYEMVGDFNGAESTYFSELVFSPNARTTTHYHPAHEEGIYCLSGEISAAFGNQDLVLTAGDILVPPPGVRHGNWNRSSDNARVFAIHPVLNPPPRVDVD